MNRDPLAMSFIRRLSTKWWSIALILLTLVAASCLGSSATDSQSVNPDRFVQAAPGLVIDRQSGLMWASRDNAKPLSWNEALSYCDSFAAGDYDDWRMPTADEILTLYSSEHLNRSGLRSVDAIELTGSRYWVADEVEDSARAREFFGSLAMVIYVSLQNDYAGGEKLLGYRDKQRAQLDANWASMRVLPVRGP